MQPSVFPFSSFDTLFTCRCSPPADNISPSPDFSSYETTFSTFEPVSQVLGILRSSQNLLTLGITSRALLCPKVLCLLHVLRL